MFENLKTLDGFDKDGEECLSAFGDEEELEGEGEGDLGDFIDPKDLTEEEKKKLEKNGLVFDEAQSEENEGDKEDDKEEDVAKSGEKRAKKSEPEEGHKRQKTDE